MTLTRPARPRCSHSHRRVVTRSDRSSSGDRRVRALRASTKAGGRQGQPHGIGRRTLHTDIFAWKTCCKSFRGGTVQRCRHRRSCAESTTCESSRPRIARCLASKSTENGAKHRPRFVRVSGRSAESDTSRFSNRIPAHHLAILMAGVCLSETTTATEVAVSRSNITC